MHPLCLFFNTRIEVLERTPNTLLDTPDAFKGKESVAYKCQVIGDCALMPVRYLFHGHTVRIQQGWYTEVKAVDHVASFYPGTKTNESRMSNQLDSGELRSGKKSFARTALAILCLIPGCLCGLFFKLPFYCCSELKRYRELTQLHFTPVSIEVGKTTPITDFTQLATALQEEVCNAAPLYRVVKSLIIHTEHVKLKYDEEDRLLFLLLSPVIDTLNPKKLIFMQTELDEMTKNTLFFNQKWTVNPTIKTVEEALTDPLPSRSCYGETMHRYYIL